MHKGHHINFLLFVALHIVHGQICSCGYIQPLRTRWRRIERGVYNKSSPQRSPRLLSDHRGKKGNAFVMNRIIAMGRV